MNKAELLRVFEAFCARNEFELNPDRAHLAAVLDGLIMCEQKYGVKYCPCRVVSGNFDQDVELLCPCNFRIQQKYKEQGECWCGLFVRRK